MKICALMIPKEMKVERSDGIKAMTDEQLNVAIDALQDLLARRAAAAANGHAAAPPSKVMKPRRLNDQVPSGGRHSEGSQHTEGR
jgi:hypothetical protein